MRNPTFKPSLETLADRIVPAVALVNGDIVVTGRDEVVNARTNPNDANDAVIVSFVPGSVLESGRVAGPVGGPPPDVYRVDDNGVVTNFDARLVTGGDVVFDGRGGNDRFENRTTLRAQADGGAGSDTLVGGFAADALHGGPGNDALDGGAGTNALYGGDGDDVLTGGIGNDLLCGQAGNDTVTGGHGDDGVQGGDGNDRLDGGLGNDILFGQAGDDVLDGGAGRDWLNGEAGNDTLKYSADATWATVWVGPGGAPIGGKARSFDSFQGGDGADAVMMSDASEALLLDDGTVPNQDRRRLGGVEAVFALGGYDAVDLVGPAHGSDASLHGVRVDAGAGDDFLVGSARFRSILCGGVGTDTARVAAGLADVSGFESVRVTNVPTDSPQTDAWSCGPNSVSRYLRAYGIDASYSEVRAHAEQNGVVSDYGLGTTPGNLIETMRHWKPDAQRVEDTDTARMIDLLRQGKPVVALVSVEKAGVPLAHYGKLHYVVMTGYDAAADSFAYTDTNGSEKTWTRAEFEDKWNWHDHFTGIGEGAQGVLWGLGLRNRTLFY